MRLKKFLPFVLAMCVSLTALAGCGTDQGGATGAATPTGSTAASPSGTADNKLPQVTLKIILPGDRPGDMDAVIAEIEKRSAEAVNAKLDVVFVPWSDLGQKTQVMLTAGENMDLVFDAPWLHMNQMIAEGYYEQLDDLLQAYGPNILAKRPQLMWDANKFDGKIMGVVNGVNFTTGNQYIIRKDIREKLGIAPIKTYEELVAFAYKVKEQEPSMTPWTPAGTVKDMAQGTFRLKYSKEIQSTPMMQTSVMLYRTNEDPTNIKNFMEDKNPAIWSLITDARSLYNDKIIYQDILTVKNNVDLFSGGKTAIIAINDFGVPNNIRENLAQTAPGAEAEMVSFWDMTPKAYLSTFSQGNFQCVPKVSKNKERAIQFLDWTNASQENYDLVGYGIEGKNWEAVGDSQYKPLGSGYGWFPYAWIWNPEQDRLDSTFSEDALALNKHIRVADNFTLDPLSGFMLNTEPVKNEIAQYQAIEDKYYLALFNGVVDPEQTYEMLKSEGGALLKKIQEESQKQIDAFLKK